MFRPASVAVPSRMPVEGASLTSGFGMRNHPVLGGRRQHSGVDLAMPTGTPVYATADGVVSKAEWFSSYGLFISLEHGAAIQTRYGHLSRLAVAAGQPVKKGDLVGYVGTTGRSTGPHLHYEVRIAGAAVNPIPYMQGNIRSAPLAAPLAPVTTWAQGDGGD
jgi:murein DD-endopeptidase MepM/ murein hydrolase activator NlpD